MSMSTILSWFSVEGSSPTPAPLRPTIAKVRERLPQGETTELSSPTGGPPLQKRVPWTSRVERDMRRYLEEAQNVRRAEDERVLFRSPASEMRLRLAREGIGSA